MIGNWDETGVSKVAGLRRAEERDRERANKFRLGTILRIPRYPNQTMKVSMTFNYKLEVAELEITKIIRWGSYSRIHLGPGGRSGVLWS